MTVRDHQARAVPKSKLKQYLPAAVLVLVVAAFFLFGPDNATILEVLRENRQALRAFVADNAIVAGLAYIGIYALATALSIPGGTMMTLVGGFLFGPLLTTVYVVIGATLGATILFLIARTAVGERLRRRAGPWMAKMEAGFQENQLSYLLILRLIPLFPFFVVNLVPAFLGVGLGVYVIGTFFGIIPGTFVYALAGGGLGRVLDAGGEFSVATVLTPEIIAAFSGLAVLAALPVIYKKYRARRSG